MLHQAPLSRRGWKSRCSPHRRFRIRPGGWCEPPSGPLPSSVMQLEEVTGVAQFTALRQSAFLNKVCKITSRSC